MTDASKKVGGTKKIVIDIVLFALVVVLFVIFMIPFLMTILNSFKVKMDILRNPLSLTPSKGFSFSNYVEAFQRMNYLTAFFNSFIVTGLSTFFVTVLSAMCAYYYVRHDNKFSRICSSLMSASMIIPFQAIMIPLVYIYGARLGLLNHRGTLIFMHTGFAMSMSVFIFQGFIKSNVPLALEEAAKIDGCGRYRTFFQIVFPLLGPTTATLIILNVLAFWNDYLLPSLVLGVKAIKTLPLSTYEFYGTFSADYGLIMAALILTVLPILVIYLVLQKAIISGVVAGAVK